MPVVFNPKLPAIQLPVLGVGIYDQWSWNDLVNSSQSYITVLFPPNIDDGDTATAVTINVTASQAKMFLILSWVF